MPVLPSPSDMAISTGRRSPLVRKSRSLCVSVPRIHPNELALFEPPVQLTAKPDLLNLEVGLFRKFLVDVSRRTGQNRDFNADLAHKTGQLLQRYRVPVTKNKQLRPGPGEGRQKHRRSDWSRDKPCVT